MTKNKFTIKKLTLILLVVALLCMQHLVTLLGVLDFSKKEIFADSTTISQISISNSNFTNSSGDKLGEPSSFTTLGTKASTVSGVIDTDVSTFQDNKSTYKLNFNPSAPKSSSDSKVLMINNQNLQSSYGYQSSSFTLSKNGYYYVSAYVYTQYTDISASASIYLSNDNLDVLDTSKIENISTKGVWKEYRFYVKTNSTDQSVSLKLYIGSKDTFKSSGAVFFDNLSAYSLSEADYYTHINNKGIDSKEIVLTNKNVNLSNGILDGDFDNNSLTDFTKVAGSTVASQNIAKVVGIGDYFESSESNTDVNPTSANRLNNKYALLINNSTPTYTAFKSNDILIEQHKLYKLSIDVKTSNFASSGAKLILEQKTTDDETKASANFDSINTSSQTNSIKNDWITYSFYINGSAFDTEYANLTLALEENAKGYVYFDNIVLEEITTTEFDNNSSSTNSKSLNFSNLSENPSISNGAFNSVLIEDTEKGYPYKAKDYTVTNSNDKNFSGIINVNANNFDAQNYPFNNPVSIYNSNANLSHNNVFVLANIERDYQIVKSPEFSLSSSNLDTQNYYKVNFALNTQNLVDYGVNVSLKTTDGETIANLRNLNTSNKWEIISIYVKTNNSNKTCVLEISLGSSINTAKGFAFIDNLKLDTSSKDAFDEATNSNFVYKTDLDKVDLSLVSEDNTNNIYTSNNFTGTKNSKTGNVEAGVINANTHPTLNVGYVNNPYILTIHNITDSYYSLKSNAYSLTSGNSYKITVSVKTLFAKQDENNLQKDEKDKDIPFGAKIELSGINAKVSGIVTGNDYETYTFYVNATTDSTIYFNLSLGDEKALTSGYAFFDNLSITQISSDDFATAKENKVETDNKTIIIGNTETKNDDKTSDTEKSSVNFDWLVVPTLITALALLIAMVCALLRKLNIKLPTHVNTVKDYDRAKTLVKDMERRERIKQREERLKALREKLQEIQDNLDLTKQEYKNNKALKEEIKVEHAKVEQKIKETFSDVTTSEAMSAERRLKLEAKQKVKQARKARYLEKRNELITKYLEVEKEIEIILEEERLLVEEWKAYKKQQKADKKASKTKKK